jgi:antitoxin VapB
MDEIAQKIATLRRLLVQYNLDGILLQRNSSFSWITGGLPGWVNSASSTGEASLFITSDRQILFTNRIETARFKKELGVENLGWEVIDFPWQDQGRGMIDLTQDLLIGSDSPFPGSLDLSAEIAWQRSLLCTAEQERFRALAKICVSAMDIVMRSIRPGQTEEAVAERLSAECLSRRVQPIVNLVGSDERLSAFRHPLPTPKKIERYAMVVLCGRLSGLVCSITRLVHFGKLPDDLRKKQDSIAHIDSSLIQNTTPGKNISHVLQAGLAQYTAEGYPDEWNNHHQGGPVGYEPREVVATLSSTQMVSVGQVFAWNPSLPGMKSEDSIMVNNVGHEILTDIPGWPVLTVETPMGTITRPAVLEVL